MISKMSSANGSGDRALQNYKKHWPASHFMDSQPAVSTPPFQLSLVPKDLLLLVLI